MIKRKRVLHMGPVVIVILSGAKLADFCSVPTETGPVHDPVLVFVLEKLNRQWLWPPSDDSKGGMVLDDILVRLEVDPVVGDVVPRIVHFDVQPGTREEFESKQE